MDTCIACNSLRIEKFNGYFFPFVSTRVFDIGRKDTLLVQCKDCGFYYADIRFTPEQMERLYSGYRDDMYQKQRQSFEPEYTPEINAALGGKESERLRKDGIFSIVNKYVSPESLTYILDYGGDHGQFFPEQYEHARRYVYDISNVDLINGVKSLTSFSEIKNYPWNLILCCHVIEHMPYPREELKKIFDIMPVGCLLYVEVPYENYFYNYLSRNEPVPIHEHINFFNINSISALFNDPSILILEINTEFNIKLLAIKISSEDVLFKYLYKSIHNNYNNNYNKLKEEIQEIKILENKILNENALIRRYPKWMINFLACFIPKQKNRKHLREKYSR